MNISISDENKWLDDYPSISRSIRDIVETTLKIEKFSLDVEISLTLTDNETIRKINNDYRNIDAVTDVISFPQINWKVNNVSPSKYVPLVDGDVLLGDIIISTNRMEEQAVEYGHSLEREFGFLLTHSILHLLGYNHLDKSEEKTMFTRQEVILKMMGIER